MTARGYNRGHAIHYDIDSEQWIYDDDGSVVPVGHTERPCGECGQMATPEGHDPCLGTLPGVLSACCGHGREDEAFVTLESSGKRLAGKAALDWIRGLRASGSYIWHRITRDPARCRECRDPDTPLSRCAGCGGLLCGDCRAGHRCRLPLQR